MSSSYIRQPDNTCRWEGLGPTEKAELADAAEVMAQDAGMSIDPDCTTPRQVEQLTPGLWTYLWPMVADQ